jgi:preprotein translocase subunit SecF
MWVAISSVIFISIFLFSALYQYTQRGSVFLYSIDFTGGTQVLLKTPVQLKTDLLHAKLAEYGWHNADIRLFGTDECLIKVQDYSSDAKGLGEKIQQAVQQTITEGTVELLQSEAVGPGIGESLRMKSLRAVIISLIAMLLYIAFRFWSFAFAIGAVIALLHDAIAMLAMLYFFNKEISMNVIGAILAVLGYSINDTIVIFSRIRQDLARNSGKFLDEIVNESINRTLTRTLLTSFSTILPVIAMLLFGGDALYNFSFVLIIGIVFGTYSSIYIASPIMMLFYKNDEK